MPRSPLTVDMILGWADAFRERYGRWPTMHDGRVGLPDTTWYAINSDLRIGQRALPGGTTLAKLLRDFRGVRHRFLPPPLTLDQILAWAEAHRLRTGEFPKRTAGRIPEAPGETWESVNHALNTGIRGLPGGITLARLLDPTLRPRPARLTHSQILGWADEHHARTGRWPTKLAGPIPDTPGDTWAAVDAALAVGIRGLPGNESLARLLARYRGVRNLAAVPRLTAEQVLAWADAHHDRTGHWPTVTSGPVVDAPGETWSGLNAALRAGVRGFPGQETLARLLARHRGVRNLTSVPRLTVEQVLVWADAHHNRTGHWPTATSGPVPEAPGETWAGLDAALRAGVRGFPGKDSVSRLLARHRGVRNIQALPPLEIGKVRKWVIAHRRRTGEWPRPGSGPIPEAPGETWGAVASALNHGGRGLPGGSTLPRLVRECRARSGRAGRT